MADDKQLTVAELLARNKAEREARGDAPRRRRRRSLEEGGISVAELTGNLPKVNATPTQAKHSNVDIDEPAPVIPAPKPQPSEDSAQPASKPAAEKPAAKPAADKPAATPQNDETTVIKKVDAKEPESKQPEAKPAEAKQPVAGGKPGPKPGQKPTPTKAELDAEKAEEAKAEKTTKLKDSKLKDKDDETGVIPVVTPELDEKYKAELAKVEAKAGDKKVDETKADDTSLDNFGEEADETEAYEEDTKINPVAIILLALIGIVLGAVVFKGFEILWGSFNRPLVAVLALVVTGVMVGVIHALRTNTDKLSMGLAAVVGLVLTFGPLLVV